MTTFIAIDQSTSATKVLLFDAAGEVQTRLSREHQQHYPQPGWVEHNAEEIYQNTRALLNQLAAEQDLSDAVFLSITNQRETIVIFEKGTGQPLFHAIVWQCRRGEAICRELSEAGHDEMVRQKTGLKIDTYFPASKLKWLMENVPGLREKLHSGEALIGTIDTYLIYRLTDGAVFATDHTNASRTLLYNIHDLAWDAELCDLFGVSMAALPEIYDSTAGYGEMSIGDQQFPIRGVMGDSHAALFAERCFEPGQAKVTFGTGSSVLLNIGDTPRLTDTGIVTTIGWVHAGQPVYALEGITNFTGGTVQWMQNQLKLINDPAETETLARLVEDTDGVYLIPAFVGLSAPYWKPNARAAIIGMTTSTTRAHVVRAALEAIAYRIRDVLDLMQDDSGNALQAIHGNGGMVRNAFLMQFVADITQLTVRASRHPDISPLGAALAGGLGLGIYDSLAEIEYLPFASTDYQPQMDSSMADAFYFGWQTAIQKLIGVN